MAIQFRCKDCQRWIEVDVEHAGAKAVCPFCQAINDVPKESQPPESPAAPQEGGLAGGEPPRAVSGPPSGTLTDGTRPGSPKMPVSKPLQGRELEEKLRPERAEADRGRFDAERAGLPPPRPQSVRLARIGVIGLVLAILSIALMLVPIGAAFRYLSAPLQKQILQSQEITPEQAKELQKKVVEEFTGIMNDKPWIGRVISLGVLLWITSLIMNFGVALSGGMHRRGYAWAGLAANGIVLFLCLCSGIMQHFMGS